MESWDSCVTLRKALNDDPRSIRKTFWLIWIQFRVVDRSFALTWNRTSGSVPVKDSAPLNDGLGEMTELKTSACLDPWLGPYLQISSRLTCWRRNSELSPTLCFQHVVLPLICDSSRPKKLREDLSKCNRANKNRTGNQVAPSISWTQANGYIRSIYVNCIKEQILRLEDQLNETLQLHNVLILFFVFTHTRGFIYEEVMSLSTSSLDSCWIRSPQDCHWYHLKVDIQKTYKNVINRLLKLGNSWMQVLLKFNIKNSAYQPKYGETKYSFESDEGVKN